MPKITFVQSNGETETVDAMVGVSVMAVAKQHRIPGIIADCNGECACSTCHVFVDPKWVGELPEVSEPEEMMFAFLDEVADNSRLCCQIRVTESLDGLKVTVPETQLS